MSEKAATHGSIELTPGVCGGKPRVAGTRVRVQDVAVWSESLGYSPDEIVFHYPQLRLADVHAALSYYYGHREEIEGDIRAGEALAEEMRGKSPSRIVTKLAGSDAGSIPPR